MEVQAPPFARAVAAQDPVAVAALYEQLFSEKVRELTHASCQPASSSSSGRARRGGEEDEDEEGGGAGTRFSARDDELLLDYLHSSAANEGEEEEEDEEEEEEENEEEDEEEDEEEGEEDVGRNAVAGGEIQKERVESRGAVVATAEIGSRADSAIDQLRM